MMMGKKCSKSERTAFHEAGHIIAHYILDVPIVGASIVEEGESLGRVTREKISKKMKEDLGGIYSYEAERFMRNEIVILYAGNEAEKHYCGKYDDVGASGDYETISDWAIRLYTKEKLAHSYTEFLRLLAKNMIMYNPVSKKLLPVIAKELVDNKQLSGKEITGLIDKFLESR
jgi:hypothetical protein